MIDFYLRAADRATLLAALKLAGMTYVDAQGADQPITANHSWALDLIGALPGNAAYHVNLRYVDGTAALPAALLSYALAKPAVEKRVWA